jgi:hypothetical protein
VTCNLFSLWASETIMKVNRTTRYTNRRADQAAYFASGVFPTNFDTNTGIMQVMQLQENAGGRLNYTGGWDVWSRFLARMQQLSGTAAVATTEAKIQTWIKETSMAANKNLVNFYKVRNPVGISLRADAAAATCCTSAWPCRFAPKPRQMDRDRSPASGSDKVFRLSESEINDFSRFGGRRKCIRTRACTSNMHLPYVCACLQTWKFLVAPETEAALISLPAFEFDPLTCGEECGNCCLPGDQSPSIDGACCFGCGLTALLVCASLHYVGPCVDWQAAQGGAGLTAQGRTLHVVLLAIWRSENGVPTVCAVCRCMCACRNLPPEDTPWLHLHQQDGLKWQ